MNTEGIQVNDVFKTWKKRVVLVAMSVILISGFAVPVHEVRAMEDTVPHSILNATQEGNIPDPEGPELEIYAENFDDPDNFGSTGGIALRSPWSQEGAGGSKAKTSSSTTAPSLPNMIKMDGTDALALPLNLTGYGNIRLSYYTRASSYISGSVIIEWSKDDGASWTTLETFELPPGTPDMKNKEGNTLKSWTLGSEANNNSTVKIRFRTGDAMQANMYIDNVAIYGQAIPGITPAPSPVPPGEGNTEFTPPQGVTLYEDVEIGTAGGRAMYSSIAVPETAAAEPMPVIVYIHGGGWNHGDRKQALNSICNYVLKRGYIGVSLDYRLTPEAPFPAQIQDVKLAIRYLRAHAAQYNLDPSRIGVWGSSAGGHLAALLGTTGDMVAGDTVVLDTGATVEIPDLEGSGGWPEYSDKVQAVADWYGPADFTTTFANNYSSVTALLGGHRAFDVPEQARLAMPGTYASSDDPPFWIRHGDADATIPYTDSVTFAGQLQSAGVPIVDLKIVPGQGHGFTGTASEIANAEAWAFLDEHVKNRVVTEPIIFKSNHEDTSPGDEEVGEEKPLIEKVISSKLPSDDAAIDSGKPDVNFNQTTGSSTGLLSISSTLSTKKYVYFKFDMTGNESEGDRYRLRIAAKKGTSNTDTELSVYGLDATDWSESSLTWSNAPVQSLNESSLLGTFQVTADRNGSPAVYEVDVTDYVKSRSEEGQVAFLLGDAGSTGVSVNVYTKEANGTSNPRPQLFVISLIEDGSDTHAPEWEQGAELEIRNWGTEFAELRWPVASDDTAVFAYRIYRDGVLLAEQGKQSFRDSGLAAGTPYTFQVKAIDEAGNVSSALSTDMTTLDVPVSSLLVASVSASGSDGNLATNTIDNNSYTRWSVAGEGQWITFDLGQAQQVGYVGIGFYKGDVRKTFFEMEISVDGNHWTQVFNGESSGDTTEMQAFDIPDTSARYVRITGHGNSDASIYTSLTDVHLYAPFTGGGTPVALIPYMEPQPPEGTVPFVAPGLTETDGTPHAVHSPHAVTGRTIDVRDYGINLADNTNDDRPAIQAAIDDANVGDEVFLPDGVYNLLSGPDATTNLMLKSGVNLRGDSREGTVLKTSLDQVTGSTVLKASAQHSILVSNMTLTSSWSGSYTTDHKSNNPSAGGPDSLIHIANYGEAPSYDITIDGVIVEKFKRMAIRIEHSRDVVVKHATFRNATDLGPGGSGYGISIQGTAKTDRLGFDNDTLWNLVEDSTFEGPYLRHGALIQFVAHNNVLRGNTFNGTKLDAIDLHGELEYFNEISGNVITDVLTGAGIGLGNTGGSAPSNHSKSGKGNYIHDNTITNSQIGISVTMGTPDTLIEDNLIENTTTIADAAGIKVLNGPGTVIRGNVIRSNTASGYWGVRLERDKGDAGAGNIGEGDPENVLIENNRIEGNTNGIGLFAGVGILLKANILSNLNEDYYKAAGVTVTEL
ncbi:alpha/beta hydrolase fold domain-containing protein [Paenibacillus sp. JNUCC31]|uniref:alpha/beta hydrolase fold domain-containing protein n=1 Tax=Paenibacillus sp. JNUCC-31 TaxID=2777983 RepID=UPI001E4497E6|nr:alpha/beta hydrolase fold domain-containing protein [Paenibacillus sp. JNUCC-31]